MKSLKPLAFRIIMVCALIAMVLPSTSPNVFAQTNVGRISGTVTDTSGAVVPDATVTVTNEATKLTRAVTTDDKGFYVVTNLPVGNYTVGVEQKGFKKAVKSDNNLVADGRVTVDFEVEPGAVTESVTVSASAGETVNTTSGEVSRVIDTAQVQELALNGRNYMQLTTLIPGAPLLNDDQLGLMTGLSVNQPINGNRGNANLLTVDGGFNLDSGSNNSQINNVGVDFIREVKIQTSNFSAEYGRNSGASINIVTRSGGNRFHGSAFEFLRNDKLDANNFFSNARGRFTDNPNAKSPDVIVPTGDARVGQKVVERPTLRYNNFGWSLGGPIKKDKVFFFAGMEWKYIRRFTNATNRSLPTRAERAGDFSVRLGSTGFLKDPTKTGTCNSTSQAACFPGNKIPDNRITPDGRAFANVYTGMEKLATAYTDTTAANNALFQMPNPFDFRQEILRIDYLINSKHSIYGRYLHDNYDLVDPFGVFITSQLPTIPTRRIRPGFSYQVGHTWLINPKLINEAKVNASWNGQRIPPVGDLWKRDTYGFQYAQLFSGGRFDNGIPDTTISNFASFNGPSGSLLSPTTDIAFADNVSINRESHSIKAGVLVVRNRKDQNGRSIYTGNVSFSTSGNTNTTGNAFADALLGNFRTYSEAENDPIGFFRFTQFEPYVTDNWRVRRNLSVEVGLRYQYVLPIYTQANNIVNFDPSLYNPAQAVTVLPNGTIDATKGGNRFNGLIRAGSGVPESELARVPNGNSAAVLAVPAGAPRGLYSPAHLLAPRLSFAWTPFKDNRTSVRGGFGIFYDRPEGNLIFSQVNLPPFSTSAQFENGNIANIASAKASAVTPFGGISAIDPNLKVPYTMNFSVSVQRELPAGIFGEITYVGNLGRHLLRQPDINQPSFDALLANSKIPSSSRPSTNTLRPYKGFSAINMRLSDSTSSYNALQLYAAKRKGALTLTGSYTWSKSLADASGNGDGLDVGEDPFNRHANYGPTSFDRRHIFVTTYTYRIPFFHGWKGGIPGVANAIMSGWELSGITRAQTGQYLTVSGSTSIGTRRADYIGGDVSLASDQRSVARWFNTAAFLPAPDERRGSSGTGIVVSPGRYMWDISMRKKFALRESISMQIQADFFNAFNQTNLNNPSTSYGSLTSPSNSFGTINGAAPGRNIQLGLKLVF
jgi:Carboxypeptidase regulatory-like domain